MNFYAARGYRGADSTLINGLGRWFANPTTELAVIKVTKGKRYVAFYCMGLTCPDRTVLLYQLPVPADQHRL